MGWKATGTYKNSEGETVTIHEIDEDGEKALKRVMERIPTDGDTRANAKVVVEPHESVELAEGGVVGEREWLWNHAYAWGVRHYESDELAQEFATWYVDSYGEEFEHGESVPSYPSASRGYEEAMTGMQAGAVVDEVGPGVPAIVGEAGPEAVIPLDSPEAVEVMAEAIEEGTGEEATKEIEEATEEAVEEVAEAAEEAIEEVAEAAEEIVEAAVDIAEGAAEVAEAESEAAEEIAEEAVEATGEIAESAEDATEEAAETVAPTDDEPRSEHWFYRILGGRKAS